LPLGYVEAGIHHGDEQILPHGSLSRFEGHDEVGLKVKGLVCSFCAQGIRKNVSKLNFVDTKKPQKGVMVDEKNGYFVVSLKSGKTPVWKDLFAAVVNAGFDVTEGQSLSDGKIVIHMPRAKK
jgi:hypothetical protein